MRKRFTLRSIVFAALSLLFVAPIATIAGSTVANASTKVQKGGTLNLTLGTTWTCFDPQQTSTIDALSINRQIVSSLTALQPSTKQVLPWLATSWSSSLGATVWTLHLRKGVTFSNGETFDAQTVKANLDFFKSLGALAARAGYLQYYTGTVVKSPYTAVVSFSRPNAFFATELSTVSLGMTSVSTAQETAAARCQQGVIGTGPFTLASYVPNVTGTLLRRNTFNWPSPVENHKGRAYLGAVKFVFATQENVRDGLLTSGQDDVITSVAPADLPQLKAAGDIVHSVVSSGLPISLVINLATGEPGSNIAVRKAINLGVNRSQLLGVVGRPFVTAKSILTQTTSEAVNLSNQLAYNPQKAEQILEAAGWTLNGQGQMVKDGKPLTITLEYENPLYSWYPPMCVLVQQELKQIGITINLDPEPPTTFVSRESSFDYQMYIINVTDVSPTFLLNIFSSTFYANTNSFQNSGAAQLVTQLSRVTNPTQSAAVAAKIQKIFVQDAFDIPLLSASQAVAVSPKVQGIKLDTLSRIDFYNTWLS